MEANSHSGRLFKGLSIQTIVTVLMGIMEISLFSIMSRLLTPIEFGYFAAISGVIAIISCISEAGLGASIIQRKGATYEFISTAFTLSCILGFAGSLFIFLFSTNIAQYIADKTISTPLKIMSVIVLLNSAISALNAILYKSFKFKRIGILQIISYFITGTIGVILALRGFGLYSIIAYNTLYLFLLCILLLCNISKRPKFMIDKNEVLPIIRYGGWLTFGTFINNITSQIDKLFLGRWISVSALGLYNRPAGFITTITGKINSIFDTVLFPVLSDFQDDKDKILEVFYRAISILNSFSVVLATIFFLNAELVVRIFFGSEWIHIVPIMRILSISVVFNIDSRLVDCFFRSLNLVKYGTYIRVLSLIITFILMFIGSHLGIMGVACGFIVAYTLITILKIIVLCKLINGDLFKMFIYWLRAWRPIIPILLLGAMFYLFNFSSLTSLLIFAFLHFCIIIFEFIFCPQCVSKQYTEYVYPKIYNITNKLMSWIKKK